ncbi:MAG TPA: heme o synthase [Patescibacteria group bacterium]|nr:heme o synthase [Patescibacteria group bacterium]
MIKLYYSLTKPGIIYGNSLSVIAGFFLASQGSFNPLLFLATLFGLSFVIASGCVFNNYLDRNIDAKMDRTKKRAMVTHQIPVSNALIFGTALGLTGFALLYLFTNLLTTLIAFTGFFFYVIVYTFSKRVSVHGTLLGSIAGAVPPVVGYTAVANTLDLAALLLFLLLVIWQMPHFYAIAIFRLQDYKNAGIPVLPIKKGIPFTKITILGYVILFALTVPFLTLLGYTGYIYVISMTLLAFFWILKGLKGFSTIDNTIWAKKMFFFSLIILLALSITISLNSFLP